MDIKKLRPWILPVVWLLGFLCAWGMILVDRQMLIQEQGELRRELRRTKRQLKVFDVAGEFKSRWQEIVDWNKENKLELSKEEKMPVGTKNVWLGEFAPPGSPERDANYSFLGKVMYEKEKMFCPKCGREGKRITGFSETVSTPTGDVEAGKWGCSNGHKWRAVIEELSNG